jgi:imidazolonepropionase-like amidohydrolase
MRKLYRGRLSPAAAPLFMLCFVVLASASVLTDACAQSAPEMTGPYDVLILHGAILIDGTGAPPRGPVDIIISRDTIERVVPSESVDRYKEGQHIIEASGMFVIPGLIDMHMHFVDLVPLEYQYKLLLAHGVTTARTFSIGNKTPEQMVAEKKRILLSPVIAPRLYIYPFWTSSPTDARFDKAKDAPTVVREWKAMGVDGIKMAGLPGEYPDIFKAVAEEAHNQSLRLAVHIAQEAVFPMNAVRVANEGATTIEHHYGYAEASFTDHSIQKLPPDYNFSSTPDRFYQTGAAWLQADLQKLHTDVIDALLADSVKNDFTMVPTMVAYEANRDVERAQTQIWLGKYTLPALIHQWVPDSHNPESSYFYHWTSNQEADWAQTFRRWMEFVNDYKNRGGKVAVGSDVGFIYNIWGFGTIRELELLEEAGFNPLETLHAATEAGAVALGNDHLGVIRPGYTADLVVLTANPLEDIKIMYGSGATRLDATGKTVQVRAIKYTIRDGLVLDSQALLKDVENMVAEARSSGGRQSQ